MVPPVTERTAIREAAATKAEGNGGRVAPQSSEHEAGRSGGHLDAQAEDDRRGDQDRTWFECIRRV